MPITEAMASGAPVVASSHPSLDEACGDAAVRADPESAEAIAAAIARGARPARRAARERPRARGARSRGRRTGELFLEGYRAILVGIDTTPLRQTRAGTARYLRGAARAPRRPRARALVSGDLAPAHASRPTRSGIRGCRAATASTSCTARPSAGRSRRAMPLVVTVHDLAVLRQPEWFNRWTRTYSRARRAARRARRARA